VKLEKHPNDTREGDIPRKYICTPEETTLQTISNFIRLHIRANSGSTDDQKNSEKTLEPSSIEFSARDFSGLSADASEQPDTANAETPTESNTPLIILPQTKSLYELVRKVKAFFYKQRCM
jgi:hypothetical protein